MSSTISNRDFLKALGLAVAALAVSAVLLIPGYLLLAPVLHPEFKPYLENDRADPIAISGNRFRPVVFGDGGFDGSAVVISELADMAPEDHAVLVHPRVFRADQFPFLRYHIEGRNPALQVILFWQRADTPGENHFVELEYSGEGPSLHKLLHHEEWRGTITELAVGFFGDLWGEVVKLHGVELHPYSHIGMLRTVWAEWTTFTPWTQSSINVYRGVPDNALAFPVPAIAIWLATSIIVILLLRTFASRYKPCSRFWLTTIVATGLAWAVLDTLWLQQLIRQNTETRYLFAGKTLHEKKLADWDGEYYRSVQAIKELANSNTKEVIVLYQEGHAALAQRMRFHLLPQFIAKQLRPPNETWVKRAGHDFDHVILLSELGSKPHFLPLFNTAIDHASAANWSLLWAQGPVAVYATNRAQQAGGSG